MSAAFIPGPWFQGTGDYQYCVYDKKVWINPDGSRGGETPNLVVVVSPADAVEAARLIAAAPDLLDAVRGLLDALPSATTHPAIKAARVAIAKAQGASQ